MDAHWESFLGQCDATFTDVTGQVASGNRLIRHRAGFEPTFLPFHAEGLDHQTSSICGPIIERTNQIKIQHIVLFAQIHLLTSHLHKEIMI